MWNIIGQQKLIDFIERSIVHGHRSHAYLIVAPEYAGKKSFALALAQRLNCDAPDSPCGLCDSCRRIAGSKHPDVQIVQLGKDDKEKQKKEISIAQVRAVQDSCTTPPYQGKYKVFIIDGAEWLSNEASNSLLKILEEPPAYVVFILLTEKEKSILPTVISRCQRFELKALPVNIIEETLVKKKSLDGQKARLIARLSRGRLNWALAAVEDKSILDERLNKSKLLAAVVSEPPEKRFEFAQQLALKYQSDKDGVRDTLSFWTDWWRDLLLVKTGCTELVTNADMEALLVNMAARLKTSEIFDFLKYLQTVKVQLEMNASPRLLFDVLMLKIPA